MNKTTTRKSFRLRLLALVAAAVMLQGCFGSFPLVRGVWSFNRDASSSPWVQEVLFLALVIIPVYEVVSLVDVLVMNSIEFWSGDTPTQRTDGSELPRERMVLLDDGSVARLALSDQGETLIVDHPAFQLRLRRLPDGLQAEDEGGRVLAVLREAGEGGVEVVRGDEVRRYEAWELAEAGASPELALAWAMRRAAPR